MKYFLNKPIAHRGLHDASKPENSLSAIEYAVDKGYPIEIDIHISKDLHAVVHHDNNLKRMTGKDINITELTENELKSIYLNNTKEYIPSFKEVLDVINGRVPLLIEIKKGSNPKKTAAILCESIKYYKGEIAIQSFYPQYLYAVRKIRPDIKRGQLATCKFPKNTNIIMRFASKNLWGIFISKPHFISYDFTCLPIKSVSRVRKKGLCVLGYTVRNKEEEENARKECDNIIFEGYIPYQ